MARTVPLQLLPASMLQLIHQRCHFDKGIRRGYIVHEIVICIESLMPVISMFYGIVVLMYYFDNKQHKISGIDRTTSSSPYCA